MISFKHILVPTDFSKPSAQALEAAIALAQKFSANITLLHVWSMPYTAYSEGLTWPVDGMEAAARTELDAALAGAARVYPKVDAVLRQGGDWSRILEEIEKGRYDLVVMGTHGRRGLKRAILGSIAERVVRLSTVPVMTVGARATPEEEVRP